MHVCHAREQYFRWLTVTKDLSPHTIRAYETHTDGKGERGKAKGRGRGNKEIRDEGWVLFLGETERNKKQRRKSPLEIPVAGYRGGMVEPKD